MSLPEISSREWAVNYCCTKGMPKMDAEAVIDAVERSLGGTLDVPIGLLFHQAIGLLMTAINDEAVQWIAVNRPNAAYREDFVARG